MTKSNSFPLLLVSPVVGPLSGLLTDHIGAHSRHPGPAGAAGRPGLVHHLATSYWQIAVGLALMGLGGGLFWSHKTSVFMNRAPRERLGIASATLATLRQAGIVTSFAVALAVAAGSLPHAAVMALFIGTNVTLGSQSMQAFTLGIRNAFLVSTFLCLVAAAFSFVRGKENRRQPAAAPAD